MVKRIMKSVADRLGYTITKKADIKDFFDMDKDFLTLSQMCKPYTQLSMERLFAIYQSVKHLIDNRIEGHFVQCGVWKGGSVMLAALTALANKDLQRKCYLYDTFEGMPEPT